jgi:hypothetical protein
MLPAAASHWSSMGSPAASADALGKRADAAKKSASPTVFSSMGSFRNGRLLC